MNFDVCCLHHLPTLPVLGLIRCGSGGAAIILIMTRWHEDDLASRLLAEADPTRGLDCGYDRDKSELPNDIKEGRRTQCPPLLRPRRRARGRAARPRTPARRAPTPRHHQKSKTQNPKWDPSQTLSPPCEEVVMDCPRCGKNLELVGRIHLCRPVTKPATVTKPAVTKVVVTKPIRGQ